jgi:predicted HNH restriction endonuclease
MSQINKYTEVSIAAMDFEEYELINNESYSEIVNLTGKEEAENFVENWRVTMNVCEKEEMLQIYSHAYKK